MKKAKGMTRRERSKEITRSCGALLRKIREAAGYSRAQLGRKCDRPKEFLDRIESGNRRIEVVDFMDLCAASGKDAAEALAELFTGRRLRELRLEKGVSTRDLSIAIMKTPLFVTFIEDGTEPLTVETFVDIVRELGYDPVEVMAEILRERNHN